LPLLTRATAENEEPTAGYMFKEIEKITFQTPPYPQQLAEYLNRKLEKPSPCVKLKVLKIMLHLIQNGHPNFRNFLRRNDGFIKNSTKYNGPPDPLLGLTLYENVRESAQTLLDALFDPCQIEQDEMQNQQLHTSNTTKFQLGGLGSAGSTKGKYEGFGSSPLDKEETVTEKMIDVLEKLMLPTDDTAEKIKSALSSSPGDYEPVPVESHTIISTEVHKPVPRVRAHVPGRAGGGWESDDEIPELHDTHSSSTVSVDSLEKYCYHYYYYVVAREIVSEFCNVQEWPVSLSQLNETCKKCSSLNCMDILEAVGCLISGKSSDASLLRALLILEWFLRTDLITPAAFSDVVSLPIDQVLKSESTSDTVKFKAKKIRLILDKLQCTY
ncbi:hypothetical protein L9F63_005055, partial [Diploptera punctata]